MGAIETIRTLAKNNKIKYSSHATSQMISRNIKSDLVEQILKSTNNQIIEKQSKSQTEGKKHSDDRYLICCPTVSDSVIVITVIVHSSELHIITAEHANESIWEKHTGGVPYLTRK